ncbi:AMIN domain-containing protein [Campylobacter sp. 2018MI35]|uniref:AMIN domain-containing protein n=1 Tax=Campylobacter sp. 2018MI34 TaxID=2800582 RepID=UPI001908F43E|nr:AMIN domain-containing protein [Campylobacter sp. 2018MI34]MBK1991079.1 AMIN domain-containing protein [Campylobacter sp. 2018MI34]
MKIKLLCVLLFLCAFANAKTNPFDTEQNLSNNIIIPESFQKEEVKFNSSARILKAITFHYINLDGSESDLNLDINKSIDWHDRYVLTRVKAPDPSKNLDVSVTIPEKNNSKSDLNTSVSIELPIQTDKIYDFIAYTTYKNKIKFNTSDEILSDFSIGNPSKIVLDFKSDDIQPTKNIRLKDSLFKRIDFGSHKGYYRLVIYLDGKYSYQIQKDSTGYIINLL